MIDARASTVIKRPLHEVFEFMGNPEKLREELETGDFRNGYRTVAG